MIHASINGMVHHQLLSYFIVVQLTSKGEASKVTNEEVNNQTDD